MERLKVFSDLDEYDKYIVKALIKKSPQNIYELQKTARVSRRAIYGRIGGEYQLKRKRFSLVQRGHIKEEKGPKLATGKRKRLFFPTFKGRIAAFAVDSENATLRRSLEDYVQDFKFQSLDSLCGALKLWFRYRSWLNPKEIETMPSIDLYKQIEQTIWNGLRFALLETIRGGWGAGISEEPMLSLSPISLDVLESYGLTRDERNSLEKELASKHAFSNEGVKYDLLDKRLKLKHSISSEPRERCTLLGGCLIVQLESEMEKDAQLKRFEKLVSDPTGCFRFSGAFKETYVQAIYHVYGVCKYEETSCPYKDGGEIFDRLKCRLVRDHIFRK